MASTLPAHVSMLTGLYPHQHGVPSNLRGAHVPFRSEPGRTSVADFLRQRGYATAAFASAIPLARSTGIDAGFETYSVPGMDTRQSAQRTNELVFEWLERHYSDGRPLFLFVHYFEPHEPCDPPAPYSGLFPSDERQEAWLATRGLDPAGLARRFASNRRVQRHFLGSSGQEQPDFGLAALAELMNRYDGEVRRVDDALGALLSRLRTLALYQGAIVAVTADHGQSLGEDLWFGHGSISNLNTFVPLVLRLPAGLIAPGRVQALVSLVDLVPTILARFELPDLEQLRAQFAGEDVLSGTFTRPHALVERTSDVLADGETGPVQALLSGRWKYVHRPGGRDELYDLEGAGEFIDVLSAHEDVAAELRSSLLELVSRRPAPAGAAAQADPELLEGLRELGYGGQDE
jgi:arylsulfatase A-like enzyme